MKKQSSFKHLTLAIGLSVAGLSPIGSSSTQAANATWNGTTDGTWATTTNWSTSPVPGTGNTATFSNRTSGTSQTISLGAGVTINTVLFDTASAAAYTIGSGAVGSQTLKLDNAGAITINSTVTASQLFNSNIALGSAASATEAVLGDENQ